MACGSAEVILLISAMAHSKHPSAVTSTRVGSMTDCFIKILNSKSCRYGTLVYFTLTTFHFAGIWFVRTAEDLLWKATQYSMKLGMHRCRRLTMVPFLRYRDVHGTVELSLILTHTGQCIGIVYKRMCKVRMPDSVQHDGLPKRCRISDSA